MLATSHHCFDGNFCRPKRTTLFLDHSREGVIWLSGPNDRYFFGLIQILGFRETALTRHIAAETKKNVFLGQHQSVVPTTSHSGDSVIFESSHSLGLGDCFQLSVSELSPILLNRGASPGVKVSVLVNSCVMILSAVDLHCLKACQPWDQFGLLVRTRKLHHSLILQKAQSRRVVASDHPYSMHVQRLVQFEALHSLPIHFAPSKVELAL